MDSGNSGSLQSSSSGGGGGEDEYDSRADSISAFLNPTPHFTHMSDPPPPHHHRLQSTTTTPMFDPLSNYFNRQPPQPQPFSTPNSLLNLDMVWSKPPRSDPNYTHINPIFTSSSPTLPFPPVTELTPPPPSSAAANSDQTAHVGTRNPKKRSRASRRAPTTVLTTDTTNFRAMVQEFTGVPAPPFTSSPFPRTRLDLFATPSSIRSNPSQPYLLRPFAQKLQSQSTPPSSSLFMSNSSSIFNHSNTSATYSNNNDNIKLVTNNNTSASTSTNSYVKQSDLILHMHDPSVSFQSQPKYPFPNSGLVGSKASHGSFGIPSDLKMGVLDEFGLGQDDGHGHGSQLSGLPNLVCADGAVAARDGGVDPMRWGCGGDGTDGNGNGSDLRSLNGNFDYCGNVLKGKLNSSTTMTTTASSTDFHGQKGSGNGAAATRGEGMVESWICSSD